MFMNIHFLNILIYLQCLIHKKYATFFHGYFAGGSYYIFKPVGINKWSFWIL